MKIKWNQPNMASDTRGYGNVAVSKQFLAVSWKRYKKRHSSNYMWSTKWQDCLTFGEP